MTLNFLLGFLTIVALSTLVSGDPGNDCGTCDKDSCESPRNCLAGLVKDSCDCCYLCGNREGERCAHESIPYARLGKCGDNLECRVRNDLERDDPREAVCVCLRQNPICGSNGVTYDNICQLTEARYRRRDGLRAMSTGPCMKPPTIVSPPINTSNATGSTAVLSCEAKGWPLPTIFWERMQKETRVPVPKNSSSLVIQSRNGPNLDETTSWLLFMSLSNEDEGTYFCTAVNDIGSAFESATVSLIDQLFM